MPPVVTRETVKHRLSYNPETGLFVWATGYRDRIGKPAGMIRPDGYNQIWLCGRIYRAHRLAWLYTYGVWPSEIDHINGDRADNRLCNLRIATRSQNRANSTTEARNPCGIKGVRQYRRHWTARIGIGGRQIHLGSFPTKEAARDAYRAATQEYFGEFART